MVTEDITLLDGTTIYALRRDERIRYLGVTFKDEIVFNNEILLRNLVADLKKLLECPLLQPDQKINIMDRYIWPQIIYPL